MWALSAWWVLAAGNFNRRLWERRRRGLDYVETKPESSDEPIQDIEPYNLEPVLYVILAVVLFLIIRMLIRNYRKRLHSDGATRSVVGEVDPDVEESPGRTNLTEDELRRAMETARAEGRFRDAIRLLYLLALTRLRLRGWPPISPESTNREYLAKRRDAPEAERFYELTIAHERSWYGNMHLDGAQFDALREKFAFLIENDHEK